MVMSDKWRMPIGLRRASAIVAIAALAVGGAKVVGDHTEPGSGFSTVATVGADPTGPTGPGGGGGMTGPPGGGSQFQPPSMPSQPDYQGSNQPPLDQNGGVNIYNTAAQGAPQQPGQANRPQQGMQSGQNADGSWQRAANGEQQPIQYSTPPAYTGAQSIPNTAPPQQSPEQGNQGQQGSQDQQPSQAPPQTQRPDQEVEQDQPGQEDNGDSGQKPSQDDTDSHDTENEDFGDRDGDNSDKCPGNVSPLNPDESMDFDDGPISIKDPTPFTTGQGSVKNNELKFTFDDDVSDEYKRLFRDAANEWNKAQKHVNIREVSGSAWDDITGGERPDIDVTMQKNPTPEDAKSIYAEYQPSGRYAESDPKMLWSNIAIFPLLNRKTGNDKFIKGTFMHELGHSMGLRHGCKGSLMFFSDNMYSSNIITPFELKMLDLIYK